jgi:transcriptional regulator with XRE-family HTH domain
MSDQLPQIAARIRALREIMGLAPEHVASDLGISSQKYSLYESGSDDIPVGTLCKIALRFGVDITDIITGESPRLHSYCLMRKEKGVSVERRQHYNYQSLAYNFAHKKAEPFLVTVDPDAEESPSLSSHAGQEFLYVLEGTLKIFLGQHVLVLDEGDSLFYDATSEHGMKALGGKPVRFLAVIL